MPVTVWTKTLKFDEIAFKKFYQMSEEFVVSQVILNTNGSQNYSVKDKKILSLTEM